jgi:hypothetical protein
MPGFVHALRNVASGQIRGHRRIERDVALLEALEQLIPLLAVRRDEIPLARDLTEPVFLVVVIHVDGPRLDVVPIVHRFEDAVEVRHRLQAEPRRVVGVHLGDTRLLQMRRRAEAELFGLVE